jgi:uncharacterized membrane protein
METKPIETHHRSAVKSISYRALSITVDSAVAYFFTQSFVISAGIVLFVNLYSTLLYYFHERIWARVRWGRKV